MLLEALWNHDVEGFNCVIFRRNSTQIRNPGGLWDNSQDIYRHFGGTPKSTVLEWDFPSGAKIKFAHLDHENEKYSYQGSQICLIGFDEVTHFTRSQFMYMLSRNRSTCGVKPYIRATCNPDSQSWVREFIDWWIDPDTGYAIPERSGAIRWFIVIADRLIWGDSEQELKDQYPDSMPKSFSFIASSIHDNKILLEKDPGYLSNLNALSRVEREQLLHGNWNIKPEAGLYFQKGFFEVVTAVPAKMVKKVRYWDRAATKKTSENDPDWTVGIKAEKDENGTIYITDMVRFRDSALAVQTSIKNTASRDGTSTFIGIEQDPGQAGKTEAEYLIRMLQGYVPKAYIVTKDKETRARPVSAQAEAGNIKILKAGWNEDFFRELENFPEGTHDDIVDALSGAFLMLTESTYNFAAISRM